MNYSRIIRHPLIHNTYHSLMHKFTDCYLISFPKSGRTWVRLLIGQCFHIKYKFPLNLDLYKMTLFTQIPNIKTDPRMGSYSRKITQTALSSFGKKKIILLVRDPRDILVSYYFEWSKRRSTPYNGAIRTFIREDFTLPHIVRFMNDWALEFTKREKDFVLVQYENFHLTPLVELQKIFNFVGIEMSEDIMKEAIERCTFNKMRKMEENRSFGNDHRFMPTSSSDKESYKMRSGVVGGYTKYLSEQDFHFLNKQLTGLNDLYKMYKNSKSF